MDNQRVATPEGVRDPITTRADTGLYGATRAGR